MKGQPWASFLIAVLFAGGPAISAKADEVQSHGVRFEEWVRGTFFDGYEGDYTQKWDVSADANRSALMPKAGIPVSIKLVKFGSPIGLGDILRQRELEGEFLMIVGFWRQTSETEKRIVEVECVHFIPGRWEALWGGLSSEKLEELDGLVKDTGKDYRVVREEAQEWKKRVLPGLNCRMVVNPKIGSTSQRRVQCSMPFKLFWELADREPDPGKGGSLFGVAFPNPIPSPPRSFRK